MNQKHIRNVAIIAHVDHGKTTLVDQLFRQTGTFRENQVMEERLMDSMDLERERGITIMAKNCAVDYKHHRINIIDTPGHADFGGEVERTLEMADGALFLVDAAEGPMPQSYFVLRKAIARGIPVIVIVNKIDKPASRCDWVVDQVFDLLVKLNAPDHILDFPVLYASAKEGYATADYRERGESMAIVLDAVIEKIPSPHGDSKAPFQMLVSTLNYSSFLGRLAIGKVRSGHVKVNQDIAVFNHDESLGSSRITKIFKFHGNQQKEAASASCGDIIAVAGVENVTVGNTISDRSFTAGIVGIPIDPPTISMTFMSNDSPFAGKEGQFVTARHIKDRLYRETLSDVALRVEPQEGERGFKVSGRGELHLSILIEKMRREGYEFQVTRPMVIFKEVDGKTLEPYEELTVDVDEQYIGAVIENLGNRRGQLQDMSQSDGLARLIFHIPTRGLLGYRSEFMTETKGMGVMNYVFLQYGEFAGEFRTRKNGVMIVKDPCETVAYALDNLQERGILFMGPGEAVYAGQIIGEYCREDDLVVNPAKGKKLTNMRAAGSDDNVFLVPYRRLSLEDCITFIQENEVVELTPKSIRLRKLKYRA